MYLPLVAYEAARRFMESQPEASTQTGLNPEAAEASRPAPSLPIELKVLMGVSGVLFNAPVAPIARWYGKVVEDNIEFARMLIQDPAGTLKDFAQFLFGIEEGPARSDLQCLAPFLLGGVTFPPVFYFGLGSFLATPDTFVRACRDSEFSMESIAKSAAQAVALGALPLMGFGGAKVLGSVAAKALRKEEIRQEEEFVEKAVRILADPIGSALDW